MAGLDYFTVTYDALGVTADRNTDLDADPDIRPMTCTIDFIYRTPPGYAFRASGYSPRPTDLGFGGFTARMDEGRLRGIDGTLNFRLPANTEVLNWEYGDLYIDIVFSNVVYSRSSRTWQNFAIVAPVDAETVVNLTTVERKQYLPTSRYADWFANHIPN